MVGITATCAVMINIVGRADRLHESFTQICKWASAVGEHDCFSAVFVDDSTQLVGDIVKSLIPRYVLPFTAASLTYTNHGGLGTLVVILKRNRGGRFCTDRRAHAAVIGVSFNPGNLAILHLYSQWASYGTHSADGVHRFFHQFYLLVFV